MKKSSSGSANCDTQRFVAFGGKEARSDVDLMPPMDPQWPLPFLECCTDDQGIPAAANGISSHGGGRTAFASSRWAQAHCRRARDWRRRAGRAYGWLESSRRNTGGLEPEVCTPATANSSGVSPQGPGRAKPRRLRESPEVRAYKRVARPFRVRAGRIWAVQVPI